MSTMTKTIGKVAIRPCGGYSATTPYKRLDVVTYEGGSYIAKQDVQNIIPTNTTYWLCLAQHGEPTTTQITTAVNTWLNGNISPVIEDTESILLDRSLSSKNAGAPADLVGNLTESINMITGYKKIIFTPKAYINTSTETVSLTPVPITNPLYNYAIIPCKEGDTFIINGIGGIAPRLWAFINDSSENNRITFANEQVTATNLELVAPANSTKLIINSRSDGICYKGEKSNLQIQINDLNKALNYGEIIHTSGNFLTLRDAIPNTYIQNTKITCYPFKEGSGTASPTNIRPIKEITNLEINHISKNFAKTRTEIYKLNGVTLTPLPDGSEKLDGTVVYTGSDAGFWYYITTQQYLEEGSYYINNVCYEQSMYTSVYNYTTGARTFIRNGGVFNLTSGNYGLAIYMVNNATFENSIIKPVICKANITNTSFEKYQYENIQIDLSEKLFNCGGITYDPNTGILIKTHQIINLLETINNGITYNKGTSDIDGTTAFFIRTNLQHSLIAAEGWTTSPWQVICSHASNSKLDSYFIQLGDGQVRIIINNSEGIDTAEKFYNWLEEQNNNGTPVMVAYRLKYPIGIAVNQHYFMTYSTNDEINISTNISKNDNEAIINNVLTCDYSIPYNSSNTVLPSYYYENNYIQNKITDIKNAIEESNGNYDAFIFCTDMHWTLNAQNSPALIKYISNNINIPRMFLGGDLAEYVNASLIKQLNESFNGKIYYIVGNHEYHESTNTEIWTAYNNGKDELHIDDSMENYYYIDNPIQKMRYIVLNGFKRETTSVNYISQKQIDWFNNVALNIPEDYTAIIFGHQITYPNHNTGSISLNYGADGPVVKNGIDNYTGAGKIACIISGHTHFDGLGQAKEGIPAFVTTCDKYMYTTPYDDWLIGKRIRFTRSEQAFDVFVIDKTNKKISAIRIGCPADNPAGEPLEIRTMNYN